MKPLLSSALWFPNYCSLLNRALALIGFAAKRNLGHQSVPLSDR